MFRHAEDMGAIQSRHRLEPKALHVHDSQARPTDGRHGVAVGMVPAGQLAPGPLQAVLPPRESGVSGLDVSLLGRALARD